MKKLAIIVILAGTVASASVIYAQAKASQLREALFEVANLEAAMDTARLADLVALGDSLVAYRQLVTQTEIERDALDQELEQRPVIRVPAGLRVDTIRVREEVPVEVTSDTTEFFRLDAQTGPFRVFGGMTRLSEPVRGSFSVDVALTEPARIDVRIGCISGPGVNRAEVLLSASRPFEIRPNSPIQADPDVCNAQKVGFSLLPELSLRGIGWELLKGLGWIALAHAVDDGFRVARYDQ